METVWNDLGVWVVASGFARRLERQRDEALEQLAAMTNQRDAALMAIRLAQRAAVKGGTP